MAVVEIPGFHGLMGGAFYPRGGLALAATLV